MKAYQKPISHLVKNFLKRFLKHGSKNAFSQVREYLLWKLRVCAACDIDQELPKSTRMPHPVGIVIGKNARLGENMLIYQNVTIGARGGGRPSGMPEISDGVILYSGSCVLGNCKIGRNAIVGANSVVIDDIRPNATVVGVPAREIKY
jgi:serine O-acetyltransferase